MGSKMNALEAVNMRVTCCYEKKHRQQAGGMLLCVSIDDYAM